MPHFKHKETGSVVEVTEEFAEQVMRPQGHYEEFTPVVEKVKAAAVNVIKKTAKKAK